MKILVLFGLLAYAACLKCPSCIHATISNVPEKIKSAVDAALSTFGNKKCDEVLTGPVDGIDEEMCQEECGKVLRCGWYKGVLLMKVPKTGKDVSLQVSKRRCYSATAANTPAEECHNHYVDYSALELSAFQEIIDAITPTLEVQCFQGQRCLYNETYSGGSSEAMHKVSRVFMVCCLLCSLLLRLI